LIAVDSLLLRSNGGATRFFGGKGAVVLIGGEGDDRLNGQGGTDLTSA
jgi:hypothetical protein